MFSIFPAFVSCLFLSYGVYALALRGRSRASVTIAMLCLATFSWQFSWAVLFQLSDVSVALAVARGGYLLILFLPTILYHFVVTLTRSRSEHAALGVSYAFAGALSILLFISDAVVDGVYHTFYGFYPRAGELHPLHVAQTAVVVTRAAYILWCQQKLAVSTERKCLRLCLLALGIYTLAAIDYACNYGLAIYPPGALFIMVSLGIVARAMAQHDLLANPMVLAATIAHELRTPLATLRNQTRVLSKSLPDLIAGYEHGLRHGHPQANLRPGYLPYLRELAEQMDAEVSRSNFIADMALASARTDLLDTRGFALHSARACVEDALRRYPFDRSNGSAITLHPGGDFRFHGSDTLLVYVLFNLIKNALAAQQQEVPAAIEITCHSGSNGNHLYVNDNGTGIAPNVLPHVFDAFYSTRAAGGGSGMGLAFCRRVMAAFGGRISCQSVQGQGTIFELQFPLPQPMRAEPHYEFKRMPAVIG